MRLKNFLIVVKDIDRSRQFYHDLFVFLLILAFIDLRYSAAVVCMIATAAAIQEGYLIKLNRF